MPEILEATENTAGVEAPPGQTDKLEARLAAKEAALQRAARRSGELEQAVATLEEKLSTLEQSLAGKERQLADTGRALSLAVNGYTAQVIAANPHIPAELITGETIEAVDSSLQTARALVDKVREGLEAEIRTARIPAGAPLRTPVDLSDLSPREKIQHGIGGL